MTTAVAPMQDFIERLKTSLRDDVARMIPEEVLAQMIQSVIREEFFTGKTTPHPHGGGHTTHPPEFHKLIIEAMKPVLQAKAAEVAQRLAPRIESEFASIIEKGVADFMFTQINKIIADAFQQVAGNSWSFQNAVTTALRNQGILKQ